MSKYLIGVDGGASHTTAVIINRDGDALFTKTVGGTNLALYQDKAPVILVELVSALLKKTGITVNEIAGIGLGLAGASNSDGRDLVFKAFDKLNLSARMMISSDAESAYRITCPTNTGIMLSVGTGIICIGRDSDGNSFRAGGKGHGKDKGSGYWMGDQLLWQLSLSESTEFSDSDIIKITDFIFHQTGKSNFESALKDIMQTETKVPSTASLAKGVCNMAAEGNQMALGILQQASREAAEYILEIRDLMHLNSDEIIIGGNGSLLKNKLYRKNLNTALEFDFKQIFWTFSELPPEFGSALLAADYFEFPISVSDLLKNSEINA